MVPSHGILDKESATTFCLYCRALKMQPNADQLHLTLQRSKRTSTDYYPCKPQKYLRIGIRGNDPSRPNVTQEIQVCEHRSSFRSSIGYGLQRQTGRSLPSSEICVKTAPNPPSLASVYNLNCFK